MQFDWLQVFLECFHPAVACLLVNNITALKYFSIGWSMRVMFQFQKISTEGKGLQVSGNWMHRGHIRYCIHFLECHSYSLCLRSILTLNGLVSRLQCKAEPLESCKAFALAALLLSVSMQELSIFALLIKHWYLFVTKTIRSWQAKEIYGTCTWSDWSLQNFHILRSGWPIPDHCDTVCGWDSPKEIWKPVTVCTQAGSTRNTTKVIWSNFEIWE